MGQDSHFTFWNLVLCANFLSSEQGKRITSLLMLFRKHATRLMMPWRVLCAILNMTATARPLVLLPANLENVTCTAKIWESFSLADHSPKKQKAYALLWVRAPPRGFGVEVRLLIICYDLIADVPRQPEMPVELKKNRPAFKVCMALSNKRGLF